MFWPILVFAVSGAALTCFIFWMRRSESYDRESFAIIDDRVVKTSGKSREEILISEISCIRMYKLRSLHSVECWVIETVSGTSISGSIDAEGMNKTLYQLEKLLPGFLVSEVFQKFYDCALPDSRYHAANPEWRRYPSS